MVNICEVGGTIADWLRPMETSIDESISCYGTMPNESHVREICTHGLMRKRWWKPLLYSTKRWGSFAFYTGWLMNIKGKTSTPLPTRPNCNSATVHKFEHDAIVYRITTYRQPGCTHVFAEWVKWQALYWPLPRIMAAVYQGRDKFEMLIW